MPAATESRESLFFDLSARTKLKITGTDRLRFLNGQMSNDVRKATMSSAISAAVLNAKGKRRYLARRRRKMSDCAGRRS